MTKNYNFSSLYQQLRQMLRGQLSRNALFSGGQAVIGMISMFGAYRVLLQEAGTERMGLWTLLIATVSFARLADITGSGGLARFVAEARGRDQDPTIYVHTVALAAVGLYLTLSLIVFLFSDLLIAYMFEEQWRGDARTLVPLAIGSSLFASPLASLLSSGIDGMHRADLRSLLTIASYFIFLTVVIAAVPDHGIWAWGVALIVQQLVIIVGAWIILASHMQGLGFIPCRWSNQVFLATFAFGVKLQLNGIASQLSEPLAKLMIGKMAGLEAVALYELSVRLVTGLRSLVVQMAQPLIPEFAVSVDNPGRISDLLQRTTRFVTIASAGLLFALVIIAPIFSFVMLDIVQSDLLWMVAFLGVGWAINTLAVPHYFAGIGCNIMRWNIGSQFVIAASVVAVGGMLGPRFGTLGIVAGIVFGLIGGAAMVFIGNGRALARKISHQRIASNRMKTEPGDNL